MMRWRQLMVVVLVVFSFPGLANSEYVNQTTHENETEEHSSLAALDMDEGEAGGEGRGGAGGGGKGGEGSEGEGEERVVEGFAMNLEGRGPEVFAKTYMNLPDDLEASTLCFWINPYHMLPFSNVLTNSVLQVYIHLSRLSLSKKTYYVIYDEEIELRQWTHVCTIIHDRGFDTYKNARLLSIKDEVDNGDNFKSRVLRGRQSFLISTISSRFYFSGLLADIKLFPTILTQADVKDVREGLYRSANCTLITDTVSAKNTSAPIQRSFTYKELLQPLPDYNTFVFSSSVTYKEAVSVCRMYGGVLPKKYEEDLRSIFQKCRVDDLMIGDIWLHNPHYDSRHLNDTCEIVTYEKYGSYYLMDWPCNNIASITCCHVPRRARIKVIGGSLPEVRFLIVQFPGENHVTLQGEHSLQVRWQTPLIAEVVTNKGQVLYTQNVTNSHFMGRNTWQGADGQKTNLCLSVCQAGEFSCSDGTCVPLSRRCDGIPADCSDNSDDDNTCWVFRGPHSSYFRQMSPADARLNVTVLVIQVRNVDTDMNQIEVVIRVTVKWRDDRLTFYNLRSSPRFPNNLHNEILDLLWAPSIFFPTALFEENFNIEQGKMTRRRAELIPTGRGYPTTDSSYEALQYPGSEVTILAEKIVLITSTCSFQFQAFPFDVQMCNIPVHLHGPGNLEVAEEHLVVSSPDFSLPIFDFRPVRCFFNASRPQEVEIGLLLARRNGAFLLSSIGPCLVLVLLGHLSFIAFPLHHFSDRASSSLSLLIVVATLFSQTTSTLPASAAPKAIDMWFFYFILRFFLFFVCHCVVEFQHKKATAAANMKLLQASLNPKEAPILKAKPPSPPLDKDKGAATNQRGEWMTEDTHDASPAIPMSPEKVNKICLAIGVIEDILFFIGFALYLYSTNRYYIDKFNAFRDCSTHK